MTLAKCGLMDLKIFTSTLEVIKLHTGEKKIVTIATLKESVKMHTLVVSGRLRSHSRASL